MSWLASNRPELPRLEREGDYPPMAMSLTNTLVNQTGTWRIFRPVYQDRLPPCNAACPAGEPVQAYLDLVERGHFLEAYELIIQRNPFPSITGRVCFHPCEAACNRREFDEALGIHNVERFIGDHGQRRAPMPRPAIRRAEDVCIVGSGPAGLTAAYFLALRGYPVTVFEAAPKPGGLLRYGIPAYRLPPAVLDREIRRLRQLGVRFRTGVKVGKDMALERLERTYQIIVLAHGAHQSRALGVPGEEATGVLSGLDFLVQFNSGYRPRIGRRVAVVGGGNTAIDAARCALRLGAQVQILYRRTRAEMPAVADEVDEAEREGIGFEFLVAPTRVIKYQGRVTGLELVRMKLGRPDESGRRRPVPVRGSEFRLRFDSVITAVGEQVDLGFLSASVASTGWSVKADEWGRTDRSSLYAAGDCVTGPRTVVEAIAMGRRTALAIDACITQQPLEEGVAVLPGENKSETVQFSELNPAYFEHEPRVPPSKLDERLRRRSTKEVHLGYSREQAVKESARCFSCGVCDHCDNCYVFCPDMSVIRLEGGGCESGDGKAPVQRDERPSYEFDYDFCKGCGVCAHECPRAAITMIEERRAQ